MSFLLQASELCPPSAPFFGFMGITAAIVFANFGGAYGTAKAGIGVASLGVFKPAVVMRNMLSVIMAGVLGIYGLIVSVIIFRGIKKPSGGVSKYSLYEGYAHLASGLSCGLSALAAGFSLGICGDAGTRAIGQQESLFVAVLLMLIFGEALSLYGLIVALVLSQATVDAC